MEQLEKTKLPLKKRAFNYLWKMGKKKGLSLIARLIVFSLFIVFSSPLALLISENYFDRPEAREEFIQERQDNAAVWGASMGSIFEEEPDAWLMNKLKQGGNAVLGGGGWLAGKIANGAVKSYDVTAEFADDTAEAAWQKWYETKVFWLYTILNNLFFYIGFGLMARLLFGLVLGPLEWVLKWVGLEILSYLISIGLTVYLAYFTKVGNWLNSLHDWINTLFM